MLRLATPSAHLATTRAKLAHPMCRRPANRATQGVTIASTSQPIRHALVQVATSMLLVQYAVSVTIHVPHAYHCPVV